MDAEKLGLCFIVFEVGFIVYYIVLQILIGGE